jgi:hypothetical protein
MLICPTLIIILKISVGTKKFTVAHSNKTAGSALLMVLQSIAEEGTAHFIELNGSGLHINCTNKYIF